MEKHNAIRPPKSEQGLQSVVVPPIAAPICEVSQNELRKTAYWRGHEIDAAAAHQRYVATVPPRHRRAS